MKPDSEQTILDQINSILDFHSDLLFINFKNCKGNKVVDQTTIDLLVDVCPTCYKEHRISGFDQTTFLNFHMKMICS